MILADETKNFTFEISSPSIQKWKKIHFSIVSTENEVRTIKLDAKWNYYRQNTF